MRTGRSIVYFAYLGDEFAEHGLVQQRLLFMQRQLAWLQALVGGGSEPTEVLVSYVAPRSWDACIDRIIGHYGFAVDRDCIHADRRNSFEYPGFLAMRALARSRDAEHLIFYCHSKGIVHLEEQKMGLFRFHTEVGLTADLTALARRPELTRAGLFPYKFGWCWYNFFWIKAGYMRGLTVERSDDRYQFEALIGDRSDTEGYRGVLALLDQVPFEETGIITQPWYRPEETMTPVLAETYDRYARLTSPAPCRLPRTGSLPS